LLTVPYPTILLLCSLCLARVCNNHGFKYWRRRPLSRSFACFYCAATSAAAAREYARTQRRARHARCRPECLADSGHRLPDSLGYACQPYYRECVLTATDEELLDSKGASCCGISLGSSKGAHLPMMLPVTHDTRKQVHPLHTILQHSLGRTLRRRRCHDPVCANRREAVRPTRHC
jgi:hypothetical protein